jgi:hypothetical protein
MLSVCVLAYCGNVKGLTKTGNCLIAGASGKKGKEVGGGTKKAQKKAAMKAVGSEVTKASGGKAASVPKRKKHLEKGVPTLKVVTSGSTSGSTAAKEDSKRDRRVEEKHPGACHHGSLLDLKVMDGQLLAHYLKPSEYMNGRDCEECRKSSSDLREKDEFGTMLHYCDKSLIAWQLPDGDDRKEGGICNLVLCPGCFVARRNEVGGRRQRSRRGY